MKKSPIVSSLPLHKSDEEGNTVQHVNGTLQQISESQLNLYALRIRRSPETDEARRTKHTNTLLS